MVQEVSRILSEIEGSGPLITPLEIDLEEDNKKAVDGEDDEDVAIELSMLIVTGRDDEGAPTGEQVCRRWNSI